ncbi:MAG: hypothetical protein AB7U35_16080, partial [Sphingobium sp.]
MARSTESDVLSRNYVGELTFEKYLAEVRASYPWLVALLDPDRIAPEAIEKYVAVMDEISWEFEDQ